MEIYLLAFTIILGFELISKVPTVLHTPLMSGANAISGITVVGALVAARHGDNRLSSILGMLAIVTATANVVGGFLVTDRMLGMFGKKKSRKP